MLYGAEDICREPYRKRGGGKSGNKDGLKKSRRKGGSMEKGGHGYSQTATKATRSCL